MTDDLRTVTRAARRARTAAAAYRAAVVTARANGHSLNTIGQAAGVTRQAVRFMLDRAPKEGQ